MPVLQPLHVRNHYMYAIVIILCTGMCPSLGEWWLHKGVLNLATGYIYAQTVSRFPCTHFVLCKSG